MTETCLFCKSPLVPDYTTGESVCGNVANCGMGVPVETRVEFISRVVREAVGDDIRMQHGEDNKDAVFSGAFGMLNYLLNAEVVAVKQLRKAD